MFIDIGNTMKGGDLPARLHIVRYQAMKGALCHF